MPRGSRKLCLLAAFMMAMALTVHAIAHAPLTRADGEALRLYRYLLLYLVAVWLVSDPKLDRSQRPSFDHALMHLVFFPFLAVYEQVVVHRWKGVAIIAGLFLMVTVPYLLVSV